MTMYEFILGTLIGTMACRYYMNKRVTYSDVNIQVDEMPYWPAPPKPILIPKRNA
jgi:hypothetical protein